jgi:hypothetical protein
MAMMEALLKIRADVQGEGNVNKLGAALGGLNKTATTVTGGLKGMLGSVGGLAGALGALTPLLSAASLLGMAKSALDAGNQLYDMSQKTGVSVEMLAKLKKAAVGTGTDIDTIGKAMIKLSKSMASSLEESVKAAASASGRVSGAAASNVDAQVQAVLRQQQQMVDAIRTGADRQVAEVHAKERRQLDAIQASQDRATQVVRDGEQRQVDAIERAADQRQMAIERESESRLREINRRYRQEEKLLNDSYDDRRDRAQEAADDEQRTLERRVERSFEVRRKEIQSDKTLSDAAREQALQTISDQQDAELEVIRDHFKAQAKVRDRAFRDEQEAAQQSIEDRKRQEEEAEKARTDAQKRAVQERVKAQKDAIKKAADEQTAVIKRGADEQRRAVTEAAQALDKTIRESAAVRVKAITDQNKQASDAFKKLGIELRNSDGTVKTSTQVLLEISNKFKAMPDGVGKTAIALQLFGKSGAEMIPILNQGGAALEKMKVAMTGDFAKAADEYDKRLKGIAGGVGKLGTEIAVSLLPVLLPLTNGVFELVKAFNGLPGPLRGLVVWGATLAVAWGPLTAILGGIVGWFTALGPTIAGTLGIVGPVVSGIIAAFTGLLVWLGNVFIPAVATLFGPVGWTVLAVAAVVAMCVAFRQPIGEFLAWLGGVFTAGLANLAQLARDIFALPWGQIWDVMVRKPVVVAAAWLGAAWKAIAAAFTTYVVNPISNAWDAVVQALPKAMRSAADMVQGVWTSMIDTVRSVLRSVLQFVANGINNLAGLVNRLIGGFNALPGPDIPLVSTFSVPAFAQGGTVNRPTLAVVGDGGEPEYIVPQSKMAAASQRFLSGVRGASVIPSSGSSSPASSSQAAPVINISTGPVLQQDGQQWVTMQDLERATRATADGIYSKLRTPAARLALGIR